MSCVTTIPSPPLRYQKLPAQLARRRSRHTRQACGLAEGEHPPAAGDDPYEAPAPAAVAPEAAPAAAAGRAGPGGRRGRRGG